MVPSSGPQGMLSTWSRLWSLLFRCQVALPWVCLLRVDSAPCSCLVTMPAAASLVFVGYFRCFLVASASCTHGRD